MAIEIPKKLAGNHGKENAAAIGAKWAETFELSGGLKANSSVLDIGCGPGRMAIAIGERFGFTNPAYLGFDISRKDIDFCTRAITANHRAFRFVHLPIFNAHYNPEGTIQPKDVKFPAEDKSVDFAFATSVFTHMRTPETLAYLRETKRCLKPGGRFFATFFCMDPSVKAETAPRFQFASPVDNHCYTATPQNPEDVIGFPVEFVLGAFKEAGYVDVGLIRGAWHGVSARHGQDIVVARRPRFLGIW